MSDQPKKAPSAAETASPLRSILHVGRILHAHGLHGEVKVLPLTSDLDRFCDLDVCLLLSADDKQIREIRIEKVRFAHSQIILKIYGIDERNAAELLRGNYISVKREQAIVLPPDQWFICDLIGCEVYDERDGYLGKLADIIQTSAHDIYVVHQDGVADLLFPAAKSIFSGVDIAGQRIDIRLPDGLFEVYRRRE